ncbi:CBS domain-containing protein [Bacillus sp. RG28]|uniref:CBS domain-containing protein n=2 Tax=Gottfriedia endophytica TaxID=2820819 RepID=A0A940NUH5_9BACI|nr:CBS domain-containing protein [Gottfriedia endophytica]
MRIKGNYVERHLVKYINEDFTLKEAYDFLIKTGYRCIPVLDKKEEKYIGNIYKVHILEYEKQNTLNEKVSKLVTDTDVSIYENSSFFELFFSIKKFPYIAVLNDEKRFLGILTHAKVLELLQDSWGLSKGGFALTLATSDYVGTLARISKIVNKYTTIQSLITLDNEHLFVRRVVVTLPKDVSEEKLELVSSDLENHGLRVIHIESL